ncbi:hypothetical protein [Nocardia carnea]|uniref:hypothetical protein n=1 Tax=Nocardia carnea TaxID=37328 RepID=UPI002453D560|nr:hypothetical protein [Nocardia carnea]
MSDENIADPARHLVSLYRYEGTGRIPISFDEEAADIRRELAADRPVRGESQPVVITELRAMIIGSLLRELAARLGAGPAGRNLAAIAGELADELIDQTVAGRQ